VILFMFIYAVAVNMPCIITQRYNRIRLARVLKKHYT
jgi:glycosyl-4,4'-diaponeurosporenoate acyltransferase